MTAQLLADLARAKAHFQLRAICLHMNIPLPVTTPRVPDHADQDSSLRVGMELSPRKDRQTRPLSVEDFISALPRLMANVDVREWDACWPWTACLHHGVYGKCRVAGKAMGAHRAIWQAVNQTVLNSREFCCHSCDNPICCNPRHIWIGDHAANMADCAYKSRVRNGVTLADPPRNHRSVCRHGHQLVGENAFYDGRQWRCRRCSRENAAKNRKTGAHPSHAAGTRAGGLTCPFETAGIHSGEVR